jgi:ABC-2 type transport system ATP-binding protein
VIPEPGRPRPDPFGSQPPVTVQDLTRRFGEFTAVDRVTFTVRTGEIFGFLGPNGAGKTTTIKMLNGLLAPSSGEGQVDGNDIRTERDRIKLVIGYMSQQFSLYPDMSVDENIVLFGGLYGVRRDRLRERRAWILEMAGLENRADRLTGELPLGWKQRLALGCAMIHEPPILFLDEPTSGVDPIARRRFWDVIDGMASSGTTVLVSTHYMEEAEYCHRLALMNRGRLIALDTPAAIRETMELPILEVRIDDPARGVEALRGASGVVDASMFGRRLHVVVEGADTGGGRVRKVLTDAGHRVDRIERIRPSLEDVFVSLVRREGGARAG